jgi:hypothetical protein
MAMPSHGIVTAVAAECALLIVPVIAPAIVPLITSAILPLVVVNVQVGQFQCPSPDNSGHYSVTGLGFEPKLLCFTCAAKQDNIATSLGHADRNGNQVYASYGVVEDIGTDHCICISVADGDSPPVTANFVSMDKDGFTLDFQDCDETYYINYKAIG